MKDKIYVKVMLIFILFLPLLITTASAASHTKQRIYDLAGLLTNEEIENLEVLAHKYGVKRETDFIILTANDMEGKDVVQYMQDFYDDNALGFDKPHGNTAILTIDMEHRDVDLAGFYKGEKYLDDHRLDLIRDKITPDLSSGNYYDAFQTFIETTYQYMGIRPGVDPNNILFNIWFQLIASLAVAGLIVGAMAYNSGGKVTVNENTYRDLNNSKVLQRKDQYVRTTTSKQRKPSNNQSSGGGGGGISRGGHSHSGSRGKF